MDGLRNRVGRFERSKKMTNGKNQGSQEKSGQEGDRKKPTSSPFPFNQSREGHHHHLKYNGQNDQPPPIFEMDVGPIDTKVYTKFQIFDEGWQNEYSNEQERL